MYKHKKSTNKTILLMLLVTLTLFVAFLVYVCYYGTIENFNTTNYDNINAFMLSDDPYSVLFYDIFAINNELIMISNKDNFNSSNIDNIRVFLVDETGKTELKLTKIIEDSQPTILFYRLNIDQTPVINIEIQYGNITRNYELDHKIQPKHKYKIIQTTLFKDDYYLINLFTTYYRNKGVEHFYLYYNGDIKSIDLIQIRNSDVVTFISWNYPYWRPDNTHYAQQYQEADCLYKYAKNLSEYVIYNDLDEFFVSNVSLNELISSNADSYGFLNNWCYTDDIPTINTIEMPSNIKKNKSTIGYGNRSKNIHKTDSIYSIDNPHSTEYYTKQTPIIEINNIMYHFSNWSSSNRIVGDHNDYYDYRF